MEPFSLSWAAEVLNADVAGAMSGEVTSICIDSRKATPGALFFALQGEHTDGRDYVGKALEAGAIGAVVSRPVENVKGTLLVVPDVLRALGDLAMHYRRKFTLPVVGVTGSVGKTSTKEMIAAVLRTKYQVLASEKNYNNEIGVPLTIFQLTKEHTAAVIEMGMRALGEIDRLAEIAKPTIGVITNIGHAHAELLGSRENIARAKAELYARLPSDGIAIIPISIGFAHIVLPRIPKKCRRITFYEYSYSDRTSDQPVTDETACYDLTIPSDLFPATVRMPGYGTTMDTDGKVTFRVRVGEMVHSLPVSLQVVGTHHIPNALAALAVAYALNVDVTQAISALENWQGAEGRMMIRHTSNGLTILDDCYNAGPESMKAALQTLTNMTQQGVAILGDMRELGHTAPEIHRQVGESVPLSSLRLLVTVGTLAEGIAAPARERKEAGDASHLELRHFEDTDSAVAAVHDLIKPGDTILVKGSRAMEMENIVSALTGEESTNGHG